MRRRTPTPHNNIITHTQYTIYEIPDQAPNRDSDDSRYIRRQSAVLACKVPAPSCPLSRPSPPNSHYIITLLHSRRLPLFTLQQTTIHCYPLLSSPTHPLLDIIHPSLDKPDHNPLAHHHSNPRTPPTQTMYLTTSTIPQEPSCARLPTL